MAKKTNPTPAKTAKKKPVTMAERVTLERVFEATTRIHVQHTKALNEIKRMVENCEVRIMQRMDSRIDATTGRLLKDIVNMGSLINERLDAQRKIMEPFVHAQELSTPQDVTGPPVTIPEQGLEPGDYTDASKEVADALTAMGYQWLDKDRFMLAFIRLAYCPDSLYHGRVMFNRNGTPETGKYYPQAEFISRASVTAKKLGLVAVEEEPWKPEVGELVAVTGPAWSGVQRLPMGSVLPIKDIGNDKSFVIDDWSHPKESIRQPTPEEVAKYHADIEAAKPIVPYVTRMMREGNEFMVIGIDDGKYVLHHHGAAVYQVPREAFKVIDP